MLGYTIRRILWFIPVLWAVATLTFFLMHAVPGGPFTQERNLPPAVEAALNRRYNLDKPIHEQYAHYLLNAVRGDLGVSFQGDREVSTIIRERFFITAQLGLMAFLLAVVVGITLGTFSALNHNGPLDYVGVVFATIGASVPHFVFATFLSIVFAINLGWLKLRGWGGPGRWDEILDPAAWEWQLMVIPVVALAMLPASFIARVTRASLIEVMNQDYIRTARAKGLRERRVVLSHAVKNSLIPVLTVIGPIFATLITGSFIIETMFSVGGLGEVFVRSVLQRDYGLIMGSTLFFAFIVTSANLAVDLAYAFADPRIRYGS